MTLYEEILAMDEAIEHIYDIAVEAGERASDLQLQISSTEQFLAYEEHRENEKQCSRIDKWLQQLQMIYEIIDKYKDADIEEQDSAGAFLKILDVVEKRCAD